MAISSASRPPSYRAAAWAALACLFLVLAGAFALSKQSIETLAGFATGTNVSIGAGRIGWHHASLDDVTIRAKSGEPLMHVAHVEARYDLRDLLPGGKRLYGLQSFALVRPQLTLIRHRDGTWNYSLPKTASNTKAGAPADVDGTIRDGSITLIDQSQGVASARELHAQAFNADLHLHSAARSQYTASVDYVENARRYPITAVGDINAPEGYSTQRILIAAMPIAHIVDAAVNSPSLHLASGEMTGADVRIIGLPDAHGTLQSHIRATTVLQHVRVGIGGLTKPVRELHGRIDLYDNGLTFDGVDGSLSGVPLHMQGGIYDLSQPHFRLALQIHGDLAQLREAIAQAAHLPMRGAVDLGILLEGPASNVIAMIALDGKRIDYAGTPIEGAHGLVAFNDAEFDLLDVHARVRGASVGAQGRVALTKRPNAIDIIAGAQAPASAVPYAADLIPGMPLRGMLLATADDPKQIQTRGVLRGTTKAQQLNVAFAVDSRGVGTVGPLVLDGSRGSIYGEVALDHPHAHHTGFVDARGVRIVGATLDANVLGSIDRGRIGSLYGDGRVRGSLAAFNTFLPALGARGSMDAPVLAYSDGGRIVAQIDRAQFRGASIAGIGLQGVSATIAANPGGRINVLAAHARVDGRDVLASGSTGPHATHMAISAAGIPAAHGAVSAGALVSGTQRAPVVTASLVARDVRYGGYGIGALSSLDYRGNTLGLSNTAIDAGPALVMLDGTIRRPQSPSRSYDITARARAVHLQQSLVDASVDANVHVGGAGAAPRIAGSVDVPSGSVNGQAFRDLHARLSGTPRDLAFSNGNVLVDTTNVRFNGVADAPARSGSIAVSAPHADLADFNDLFDTGETLGGTGAVAMTASYAPGAPIVTSGSVDVANFRYRRFDVGSTVANWNTARGAVHFVASAGGASGTIRAHGSVNASTYALAAQASVRQLDLQTWLPIVGVNAPVLGRVDADAAVAGRFPEMDSRVSARVLRGMAWGVPVQPATLAMHTAGGRGALDRAVVQIPNATANASGTFGLHAGDPLNITAHAGTPDIGAVAREAGFKAATLAGAVQTTALLRGTRLHPQVSDATTIDAFRYQKLTIPHAAARLTATTSRVSLQRGEVDLLPGRILLAGTVPLPLRNAPFTASVVADDVELAQFGALLPEGTELSGRVDGRVNASGRTDDPQFAGAMTLAQATYSSPQETVPVTNVHARLALRGTHVRLQDAHADLGGGTVDASGGAFVPSVRDLGALAFHLRATANHARVDAPAYYKGLVDGTITASRAPRAMTTLGGAVAMSSGRVPLTALYNPKSSNAPASAPLSIAFNNLQLTAGRDIRVQSPNVDVGAEGGVTVSGTLANPLLLGSFVSTGGTLSFYRDFTIEDASVSFDGSGVIPNVDAVATTYITDPSTSVRIHVTGPATGLNLALASDPPYDRTQILGLLAGVYSPNSTSQQHTFTSLAEGQLNTVFTRNLLEPLSTALGGAFGFNNVQLTNSLTGGFGAHITKALGKTVSFVFAESFGEPRRQSFSLETSSQNAFSLHADVYSQDQPTLFSTVQNTTHGGLETFSSSIISIQPMSGTNGFDIELQRKYP